MATAKKFVFDPATLALWSVAESGHTDALEGILSRGVNINARNQHGMTALMRAAHNGHERMALLLRREGIAHWRLSGIRVPGARAD